MKKNEVMTNENKTVDTTKSTKTNNKKVKTVETENKPVETENSENKPVETENAEKRNLTLDEVYALFITAINGKPIKCNYSNAKSQPYCGLADFSVNMKKTSYNVYMSAENAEIVKQMNNTVEISDNKADTTKNQLRCKLVKFTDGEALKNAINTVVAAKKAV